MDKVRTLVLFSSPVEMQHLHEETQSGRCAMKLSKKAVIINDSHVLQRDSSLVHL